jgi:hypothetical protein
MACGNASNPVKLAAEMSEKRPWYAEPWVWLMITFPLAAVIGGMITIYLAVSTSDGLVVDDYYKRGKAINVDLARDRAAARYGMLARIEIDLRNNRVQLQLTAPAAAYPDVVTLSLLHPTRAGHDQVLQLPRAADGGYSGDMDELTRGNWYLQLEAADWRLFGSMQVPAVAPVVLLPAAVAGP